MSRTSLSWLYASIVKDANMKQLFPQLEQEENPELQAKSSTPPPSPPSHQESEFLPPSPNTRNKDKETCVKAKSTAPPLSPPSHEETTSSKGLEFQLPSPASSKDKKRQIKSVKSPPTPSPPPSSCSSGRKRRRLKPCPIPKCSSVVQQLTRHLRLAHKLKGKEARLLSDRASVKCVKSATPSPSPPSHQESEFLPPSPSTRNKDKETCVKAKSTAPPLSPPSHEETTSSKGLEFQLPSPASSKDKKRQIKAKSTAPPLSPPSHEETTSSKGLEVQLPSPASSKDEKRQIKAKSTAPPLSPPSHEETTSSKGLEFQLPSPATSKDKKRQIKAKSATPPHSPPSHQESEFLPPSPSTRNKDKETCVKAKSTAPPLSPPSHEETTSSKGLEFQLPSPASSKDKKRQIKSVKSTPSSPPSSCSSGRKRRQLKPCPIPKCNSVVQQLARHLRLAHKLKGMEARLLSDRASVKRAGESVLWKCPILGCGKERARVDRHLQNEHHLKKGSQEYKQLMTKCKAMYLKQKREKQEVFMWKDKREESGEKKNCHYIEPMLSLFKNYLMDLDGGMLNETNANQCVSRIRKICKMVGGVSGLKNIDVMRKWFYYFQDQTTKAGKKYTVNTVTIYVGNYRNFMKFAHHSKISPFEDCADALYKETKRWQSVLNPLKLARDIEVIANSRRDALQHSAFLKLSGNYPVKTQALDLLNMCEVENIHCDDKGFITVRDYVMMLLVQNSGQRSGCLRSLTCSDILNSKESEGQQIILASTYKTASSGRAAKIVLAKSDFKVVQKYIQHIRPSVALGEMEYAFTDLKGKKLTSACFDKRMKAVWASAGNKSKFSCSLMRQFFFGSSVTAQCIDRPSRSLSKKTPGDNTSPPSLHQPTPSSSSSSPPPSSLPPPPQSPPLAKQAAPSTKSSSSAIRPRSSFSLKQDENIRRAFDHHITSSGSFNMRSVRLVLAEDASLSKCLEGFEEGDGPKLNKKIYDRVRVFRKKAHKKSKH